MNNGKQNNARRISFLEEDPCLTGLVRGRKERENLRSLESRMMSTYESAMILARLLAPDSQNSEDGPQRRPAGSFSPLDMLRPVVSSAS